MRSLRSNEVLFRSPFLKSRTNASITAPARWPSATICVNACLAFIQIGQRAIEESASLHRLSLSCSQRLLDLVSDRGRDGIARHQSGLTLATLSLQRALEQ